MENISDHLHSVSCASTLHGPLSSASESVSSITLWTLLLLDAGKEIHNKMEYMYKPAFDQRSATAIRTMLNVFFNYGEGLS